MDNNIETLVSRILNVNDNDVINKTTSDVQNTILNEYLKLKIPGFKRIYVDQHDITGEQIILVEIDPMPGYYSSQSFPLIFDHPKCNNNAYYVNYNHSKSLYENIVDMTRFTPLVLFLNKHKFCMCYDNIYGRYYGYVLNVFDKYTTAETMATYISRYSNEEINDDVNYFSKSCH